MLLRASLLVSAVFAQAQVNYCISGPVDKSFFNRLPKGPQFPTGPCQQDSECCTACCGQNKRCRIPEGFQKDGEFCHNGLTKTLLVANVEKEPILCFLQELTSACGKKFDAECNKLAKHILLDSGPGLEPYRVF
jgi:hypothetical protein